MTVRAHIPVMLEEVVGTMAPRDREIYVDGTFGAGGYSRALLKAAHCRVYAIDRDPSTRRFAEALERDFPGRFVYLVGRFSEMCELLAAEGIAGVHGVVLDIGVSSMQLADPARGFSFQSEGPLDMRMSASGMTAADAVNRLEEEELADILYRYGEEKASRRIARAIVDARREAPIADTARLAEIIRRVARQSGRIDPATRTFQALRVHVNDELGELERGLEAATRLLLPGGRLVVVTFHSLEDRIVKRFMQGRGGRAETFSRHAPPVRGHVAPPLLSLPKGWKKLPSTAETRDNPRARSATLRLALRAQEEER